MRYYVRNMGGLLIAAGAFIGFIRFTQPSGEPNSGSIWAIAVGAAVIGAVLLRLGRE